MPYQIASLFHMYIDMGERIYAGKQDRFSLIIEDPLRAPKSHTGALTRADTVISP